MRMADAQIVVVDDDLSYRTALSRLLKSAGYDVCAFGSGKDFLDQWEPNGPACVLLDLRLPGVDGLEVFHERIEGDPSVAVIFLTAFGDVPTSVEAMKSGAFDFLEKPVPRARLLDAVGAALAELEQGREDVRYVEALHARYESLTPREREVMNLIVRGMLNKQIARELGISIRTVKVHRARVMKKMGAPRLPHLMTVASRLGLIPGETSSDQSVH